MPVRKRYPKLPNGYGSIKYLGKKRRNPYAVHPPVEEFKLNGSPITPKALCYVDTWIKGFAVLTAYKAGTYEPGYEKTLADLSDDTADLGALAQKILADYNTVKGVEVKNRPKTFTEIYEEFYKWKFDDLSKEYSTSTVRATRSAFKNCGKLHNRVFVELRYNDLQEVIDECQLKYSSKLSMLTLLKQMYGYADTQDIIEKDYSAHLRITTPNDNASGIPFDENELKILWANKDNQVCEFLLIMCYSGYRISAYKTITVNLEEKYFFGGVKTRAGKDRYVPIHPAIYPLVKRRLERDGKMLSIFESTFRYKMYEFLESCGIQKHTPHDCRHTFSMLCEKYGVKENDRKRMLGHAFYDTTNKVYGHRDIEDLRKEIEKIKCY